jgi:hypothetical protein
VLAALAVAVAFAVIAQPGAAAAAPTVSPAVKRTFIGFDAEYLRTCPYGYLCAFVRTRSGYYRFDFTRCRVRYRVSGWHGGGWIANNQWGGVTARFYDADGAVYAVRRARGISRIGWEPVWSLRVC